MLTKAVCIKCDVEFEYERGDPRGAKRTVCVDCKRATKAAWRRDNKSEIADKTRKSRAEHRLARSPQYQRRRIYKKCNKLGISLSQYPHLFHVVEFSRGLGPDWEVDHIIPKSRGGLAVEENLQIVPGEVNRSKKTKTHAEFIGYLDARGTDLDWYLSRRITATDVIANLEA